MPDYYLKKIRRISILSSILIIALPTICFMIVFTIAHFQYKTSQVDLTSTQVYTAKKRFIKNTINRTIADIESERAYCQRYAEGQSIIKGNMVMDDSENFCSENKIKDRIKDRIRNTTLPDEGYIWINKVLNYTGGKDYAIRLVHPNLIETEGMMLSTSMTDIKGNTPYLTELNGITQKGELFFEYWFTKKNSNLVEKKLAFAKLYKPYDWIIATGVYFDDVEAFVTSQKKDIELSFYSTLAKFLIIGTVSVFFIFLMATYLNRKLFRVIYFYQRENEKKEKIITQINDDLEKNILERTKQLEKANKNLMTNEKKYCDLYDNAPDMYVSVDAKTARIINCNQTLATKLDYPKAEIIGRPIFDVYHPDSLSGAKKSFQKFTSTGRVDNEVLQLKRKDGSRLDVILNVSPVCDEQGNILYSRSAWRDITEYKQIEKERESLKEQLRQSQKLESIGNLAGGIAHDFNNILSSIIGFTELALNDVEKGTDIEDDLQEVRTAGNRAKDLVKQILTFARQSDESINSIQVGVLVEEVIKFIKSSIPASIRINENIKSDSFIMGSPTQVHQIFMNLCTNASHAMEADGGILGINLEDVTIDKACSTIGLRPGEYIKIEVSDTGIGISPKNIKSVFEPYFTTKLLGEGTGMGLAVVHGIVENYGGRINVDSKLGDGTTFTVYLPITKKRPVQAELKRKDLPKGNENILFVDDEAVIAKMGERFLEQLGYFVTTKTSSIEALELFRSKSQKFDLVITDMTMPELTGDKLSIELMKIRPDIPVILCTGYSQIVSEKNAADIGIRSFAYKPIVQADLAKMVRKTIDGYRFKPVE